MALFVTRSTRAVDTTGPTAPTIVATPASTSTVSLSRTVASTDISGVQYYETQRSLAGAGSWTTFDSSNTNPLTAAGLNPSTSYDFRQRGVDTLGNLGTFSTTASAITDSAGGEWADTYTTVTGLPTGLSVNGQRVGIRGTSLASWGPNQTSGNGGQLIYRADQSFDGLEPIIEFRPPTTLVGGEGQYNTILGGEIARGGLNNIKQMNFRWCEYIGPRYWDLSAALRPKWSGFIISTLQNSEVGANRVSIFDQPQTAGTIFLCVTATTVQAYNFPTTDDTAASKLIAIRGTNNHALNAPQTGGGEWLCFEQVVDCMQNRGNAFGRHELRVWSRDGAMTGRLLRISLNYDAGWNFARQFIYRYEGLGSYFNQNATANTDNYKLWSHCTFAANMGIDELMGPPPGFLL